MVDVFLSYKRSDAPSVRQIAALLESHGLSVWWDERIPLGGSFKAELARQLQTAKAVVVLWSSESATSDFVSREADYARQERKLIPVSLDGAKTPSAFAGLNTISLESSSVEQTLEIEKTLLRRVQTVLRRTLKRTEKMDLSELTNEFLSIAVRLNIAPSIRKAISVVRMYKYSAPRRDWASALPESRADRFSFAFLVYRELRGNRSDRRSQIRAAAVALDFACLLNPSKPPAVRAVIETNLSDFSAASEYSLERVSKFADSLRAFDPEDLSILLRSKDLDAVSDLYA